MPSVSQRSSLRSTGYGKTCFRVGISAEEIHAKGIGLLRKAALLLLFGGRGGITSSGKTEVAPLFASSGVSSFALSNSFFQKPKNRRLRVTHAAEDPNVAAHKSRLCGPSGAFDARKTTEKRGEQENARRTMDGRGSRFYPRARNFDDDWWYSSSLGNRYPNRNYGPLRITDVDILSAKNAVQNHTEMFQMTQRRQRCLILRRGESFNLKIVFNRIFDSKNDEFGIVLMTGRFPRPERQTKISLAFKRIFFTSLKSWSATIVSSRGNEAEVEIRTDVDAVVGTWGFELVELKFGSVRRVLYEYDGGMYMLFNPYHSDDVVYMENKANLKGYFEKEYGNMFQAAKESQISTTPWNYGQFQDDVLLGTMKALMRFWDSNDGHDRVRDEDRADPVKVSRKMTYIIGNFVLYGRWDGVFDDGKVPWAWRGSVKIIKEYLQTGQPVKYGQCWVFAGVLTTMLRTLGIPSRVITNVISAHDSNRDLTLDMNFIVDKMRGVKKDIGSESFWNYHVWSEGWMKRPDLATQYGSRYDGWQVLDATRQVPSEDCPNSGLYEKCWECGPMPVAALRESNLTVPYDGPYIYAEFNADLRELLFQPNQWGYKELISIETRHNFIGQAMVTTSPNGEMMDVTDLYKPPENDKIREREGFEKAKKTLKLKSGFDFGPYSGESRSRRGRRSAGMAPAADFEGGLGLASSLFIANDEEQKAEEDLHFEMTDLEEIKIGDDIKWSLTMRNNSAEKRSVKICADAHVIDFMGNEISEFFASKYSSVIPPKETKKLFIDIPYDSFESHLGREWFMDVCLFAVVQETLQMFRGSDKFNMKQPELVIEAPKKVEVSVETDLKISIKNPYKNRNLTNCVITLEANGLALQPIIHIKKDIAPYQELVVETSFGPAAAQKLS
ncbi:hypothetical protein L596_008654 [Steinernema carpocapsae]|uniref:Transglutaminase-like domain-containing protein n=2 Tax=Steinernema carpocapsae TaxID=34508 RepID=A0A4U5PD85_STECR|nr:hypothetical protein L596_008654 [Steinernema carpocapsae]